MKIKFTKEFERKFEKLKRKDRKIKKEVDKKLLILVDNPKHKSLRLHKLISNRYEAWSISIGMQIRILFIYREYGILLIDIGSHDEIY